MVEDPNAPRYFKGKQPRVGDWHYKRHCYFADIAHLDHQLGPLLKRLKIRDGRFCHYAEAKNHQSGATQPILRAIMLFGPLGWEIGPAQYGQKISAILSMLTAMVSNDLTYVKTQMNNTML